MALLLVGAVVAHGAPSIDAVHAHMEPASPKPVRPKVRRPPGLAKAGGPPLATALRGKGLLVLLPAAAASVYFAWPKTASWLLTHLICLIGSLLHGLARPAIRPRPVAVSEANARGRNSPLRSVFFLASPRGQTVSETALLFFSTWHALSPWLAHKRERSSFHSFIQQWT